MAKGKLTVKDRKDLFYGRIGNIRYEADDLRALATAMYTLGMDPLAEKVREIARIIDENCDALIEHAPKGGRHE